MEDRSKFREWNVKFINALSPVNPKYEAAMKSLMKRGDEEISPEVEDSDLSSSWPSDVLGDGKLEPEDREQLDKDLRCVLIGKASGTVHT